MKFGKQKAIEPTISRRGRKVLRWVCCRLRFFATNADVAAIAEIDTTKAVIALYEDQPLRL